MRSILFVLAATIALLAHGPVLAAEAPSARRLRLSEAVALASGQTPAVAIADLRNREAEARSNQARAALLPSLSGSVQQLDQTFNIRALGISFPTIPGVPPTPDLVGPVQVFDARVRASQTLFAASDWMRWRASRVGVTASRADRGASSEAAAHGAALAYLSAARAQAVVDARSADVEIAQQLRTLAESQQQAGVAPAIDVTRARTEFAASRVALLSAANQLDAARIDLARSLGVDPEVRFDPADSLNETLGASNVPTEADAAVAFALERRPDLKAENARVQRARAERSATSAERLPRFDVAADYGASGEHASDAIATRSVSVAVSVPLLDGLRREGRIAEQGALLGEAQVRARDLRDQIGAEVRRALLDLDNGTQQISLARERLELAQQELNQARERFENGVAGNIEVINAQSSLIRALV